MIENLRDMMKQSDYPKKNDSPEERRWKHYQLLLKAKALEHSREVDREVNRITLRKKVDIISPEQRFEDYRCNTYEEFHQMVLQSIRGFMIILNTKGVVAFVADDIWNILRFHPDEVVGNELIEFLPEDQKWFIERKINLTPPLMHLVGMTTEFCCDFKRGDSSLNGPPIYEYVKIILSLKNAVDEPVFLGKKQSSPMTQLHYLSEENFYFVGTLSVLKHDILKEIYQEMRFIKFEIRAESDEESSDSYEKIKPKKRRKMQITDEIRDNKVEYDDICNGDRREENVPVKVKQSASCNSFKKKAVSPGVSFSPNLQWETEIDPRLKQDPVDIEIPVDPTLLYNSSDEDEPPRLEKYDENDKFGSQWDSFKKRFQIMGNGSNTDDSSDWGGPYEDITSYERRFLHPGNLMCLMNEETNQEPPTMPVLQNVYALDNEDYRIHRRVNVQRTESPSFKCDQNGEDDQTEDGDFSALAKDRKDFHLDVSLSPTFGNSNDASRGSHCTLSSTHSLQTQEDFMLLWQETPPSSPQVYPDEDSMYDHTIKFKENVLLNNKYDPAQSLQSGHQNILSPEPLQLTYDQPSEVNVFAELNQPTEANSPSEINLPAEINQPIEANPLFEINLPDEICQPIEANSPSEINLPAEINQLTEANPPFEINLPDEICQPIEANSPSETNLPAEINQLTEANPPFEINLPDEICQPIEANSPFEINLPAEINPTTDLNFSTEVNLFTELNVPTMPNIPTEPNPFTGPSMSSEINLSTKANLFSELNFSTDLNFCSELNLPSDLNFSNELNVPTDPNFSSEADVPTELNQPTEVSLCSEPDLFTELNLFSELNMPTESNLSPELDLFTELNILIDPNMSYDLNDFYSNDI